LKIDNQIAAGALQLELSDSAGYDLTYQTGYINGSGMTIYTGPASYRVDARMNTVPLPAVTQTPVFSNSPAIRPPSIVGGAVAPSGEALFKGSDTVGDLTIVPLDIDARNYPRSLCWSRDGQSFYCVSPDGVLRRISLSSGKDISHKDLNHRASWLTRSTMGLIVTVPDTQEAWLINFKLAVVKKFPIAGAKQVVSAPSLSIAIACDPNPIGGAITILDLKTGSIARQYQARDLGLFGAVSHPTVTPDGKFLLVQSGIEELKRFRIDGTNLLLEESSARIAQNGQGIDVSPDSKYVCLPSGGGNYGAGSYSTFIYRVNDLARPQISLASGAYPRAVGFDPKGGYVYAQNHQHQLIIFNPAGIKLKEQKLGQSSDVKQFLVHPEGRKLLVLTDDKLYSVQVKPGD
jgi:DNA-binding beta-propeller fold protein YncE